MYELEAETEFEGFFIAASRYRQNFKCGYSCLFCGIHHSSNMRVARAV